MSVERIRGERVTLRPLEAADAARLAEIAAEPEVARWWLGLTEEEIRDKAGPNEDALVFAVELDGGTVIGLAQAGEEDDPRLPPREHRPLPLDRLARARARRFTGLRSTRPPPTSRQSAPTSASASSAWG